MRLTVGKLFSCLSLFIAIDAFASSYTLPTANDAMIGSIQHTSVSTNDSAASLGKNYDIGHNAIKNANPHLDFTQTLPYGAPLQIPTEHLLPNQPREGIVVNLAEMRIYYYPTGTNQVFTYPVGIGKIGKTIPIRRAAITRKVKDPVWVPPQDIREFNLEQGIVLPKIMPAGPDNPLGPYAIYMTIPTYLIHSTIFPESVGKRASFGCLRMYESDIQDFFPSIQKGIPVIIINAPVKTGWHQNQLYVEAHQPLEEHSHEYNASLPGMIHDISSATENTPTLIDWQLVDFIAHERDGIPHAVGVKLLQTS